MTTTLATNATSLEGGGAHSVTRSPRPPRPARPVLEELAAALAALQQVLDGLDAGVRDA